jgi:ribonucleoside-diphosphate reductase alpha chain
MRISKNAQYILSQRYLLKDENRELIETPSKMFRRVAKAIAQVELKYGMEKKDVRALERQFYAMMTKFEFLPNSPTLMNAGTDIGQLSACFVLPVDDDIDKIFEAVHYTAKIHKTGGGTGFSFSRIRPKGDVVKSTGGIASGPLSFMRVFDMATEVIKQGGKRRGANMGIIRVDHPDIQDFIISKEKEGVFKNFNLSVAITDKFMSAVRRDDDFDLINPRTNKVVKTLKARVIWNLLCFMSWKNGEPAVIFIDRINKDNPTPKIGQLESTNPCGEMPLLPYESCNLGSINLSAFYTKKGAHIDWEKLKKTVRLAVRFLDNVIDVNKLPLPEIQHATFENRKIGLGVMGWADLLVQMGIRYDSQEAVDLAEAIMKYIHDVGFQMSQELGKQKGNFPNFEKSIYCTKNSVIDPPYLRNATITTIAPTGTISLIANCSQSIEPIFEILQKRNVSDTLGKDLIEINPSVKRSLELKGLWTKQLEDAIASSGSMRCIKLPSEVQKFCVTSSQVSPEWHIKMQAAFQKHTDNAVSKTVNLPNNAEIGDIENIYFMAYQLRCKGITVYRDGSRKFQLLEKAEGKCPTCPD